MELGSSPEVSDLISQLYTEHVDTLIEHLDTTGKVSLYYDIHIII